MAPETELRLLDRIIEIAHLTAKRFPAQQAKCDEVVRDAEARKVELATPYRPGRDFKVWARRANTGGAFAEQQGAFANRIEAFHFAELLVARGAFAVITLGDKVVGAVALSHDDVPVVMWLALDGRMHRTAAHRSTDDQILDHVAEQLAH